MSKDQNDLIKKFNQYQEQRYYKILQLRNMGIDPFPIRSERTHTTTKALLILRTVKPDKLEDPSYRGMKVTVAGRVKSIRDSGKSCFVEICDGAEQQSISKRNQNKLQKQDKPGQIQLYFSLNILDENIYTLFKKIIDNGDIIQATGSLFLTKTKTVTIEVTKWVLLAKAINQPPEKWHGLTDTEQRYRERYADLLSNGDVRELFIKRAKITYLIRQFMESEGYIECETPILQPIYGGGNASPFVTHHNYAKRDLYLRIADELYLKRLIVGGLEKVYEIGKDFRNEGISFKHNPEFTMLEAYQAYGDYHSMMGLIERCYAFVVERLYGRNEAGKLVIPRGEDGEINVTPPFERVTMQTALLEWTDIDIYEENTIEKLTAAIESHKLKVARKPTWGKQVDELFGEFVEPHLIQPTFIVDYPRELSPLAKQKPDNPNVVERFELFIGGAEQANAFTELNDPLEQYERFMDQQRQRAAGDDEAQPIDEDYINALMYGMPPTGGIGWGIDRMMMLLLNKASIREIILFPQLRASTEE